MVERLVVSTSVALLASAALVSCSTEATAECHSDVITSEVPEWASTGFSPGAEVPHVIGKKGLIVAVQFSMPLVATPEDAPPQNKVLLVAKVVPEGSAPLTLDAQRNGMGDVVRRVREGGPGPGILDLPTPGCWRVTMHWADQEDTVDLEYVSMPSSSSSAS